MSEIEEWRDVPNLPFKASTLGRISGPRSICKGSPDHGGYLRVSLPYGRRKVSVHSMVMAAFKGPRPGNFHIDHINGIKADNRLANLRYASKSANEHNKHRFGKSARGERNRTAKLTVAQVLEIRSSFTPGRGQTKRAAEKYGVTPFTIYEVVTRRTWAWLPDNTQENPEGPQ